MTFIMHHLLDGVEQLDELGDLQLAVLRQLEQRSEAHAEVRESSPRRLRKHPPSEDLVELVHGTHRAQESLDVAANWVELVANVLVRTVTPPLGLWVSVWLWLVRLPVNQGRQLNTSTQGSSRVSRWGGWR